MTVDKNNIHCEDDEVRKAAVSDPLNYSSDAATQIYRHCSAVHIANFINSSALMLQCHKTALQDTHAIPSEGSGCESCTRHTVGGRLGGPCRSSGVLRIEAPLDLGRADLSSISKIPVLSRPCERSRGIAAPQSVSVR
jgi:hypothetical protein